VIINPPWLYTGGETSVQNGDSSSAGAAAATQLSMEQLMSSMAASASAPLLPPHLSLPGKVLTRFTYVYLIKYS